MNSKKETGKNVRKYIVPQYGENKVRNTFYWNSIDNENIQTIICLSGINA